MNTFKKSLVSCMSAVLALLLISSIFVGCEEQPSSNSPSTRPGYYEPSDPSNPTRPGNNPSNPSDEPTQEPSKDTSGNPDSEDTSDAPSQPEIEYAVWDGSIASGFDGGDGTESSPYEIADGAQLAYLARQVANENTEYSGEGVHYILTDNIDLNNLEWCPIGTAVDLSGNSSEDAIFRGVFDGNNQHIANIAIQNGKSYHLYFGLFGYIEGATIRNLTIDNLNYSEIANAFQAGGLVGRAYKSVIDNCVIQSGSISGTADNSVGGFVGMLYDCTVLNCNVTANIQGRQGGGFAASIESSMISDCSANTNMYIYPTLLWNWGNEANVSGGFVGYVNNSSIMYSKATGNINGARNDQIDYWAGGFAGRMDSGSAISDCYASGSVDLSGYLSKAAGFVAAIEEKNTIIRCISFGDAHGNRAAGFCIGAPSFISSCIAYGNVYGSDYAYPFTNARVLPDDHCYRPENQIVSPQPDNTYGIARYMDDMIRPEFFTFNPFFELIWDFSDFSIAEKRYPQWKDKDEQKKSTVEITDINELSQLQGFYGTAYLTQSLEFPTDTEWGKGVDFFGTLDGQGNEISNLPIGYVFETNFGIIKNICITNTSINIHASWDNYDSLGFININHGAVDHCILDEVTIYMTDSSSFSLIANNIGVVSDCMANIKFDGSKRATVGGIVGNNSGNIMNCYTKTYGSFDAHYSGSSTVSFGGIALSNAGKIEGCRSYCDVTVDVRGDKSSSYVYWGGITCDNGDTAMIFNCYSDCKVSISNNAKERARTTVGGISASNSGLISDCFATVNIPNLYTGASTYDEYSREVATQIVGGIVGDNSRAVQDCIAKTTICGRIYPTDSKATCLVGNVVGTLSDNSDGTWGIVTKSYFHENCQIEISDITPIICNEGTEISANFFNDESFYFDTLQFSKDIWEMSDELGHIVLKQK